MDFHVVGYVVLIAKAVLEQFERYHYGMSWLGEKGAGIYLVDLSCRVVESLPMYPPADLLFELKWLFSLCVGFFALSINLCASQKKLILQLRQKYYIVIGKLLSLTKAPV